MTFRPKIFTAHLLTIILWASAFPGIRMALTAYTPTHVSLLRLLVGSLLLLVVALFIKLPLPDLKDIPIILLLGFLAFAVYHVALNYGEQTVSAGPASLLVSTAPIFTAIMAVVFFRERFKLQGWIGAFIAIVGVGFISLGGSEEISFNLGAMLILLAALSESVYFVFQNAYLQKYGFFPFTMYTIWGGTICMLVFSGGLLQEMATAPIDVTMAVVYLGIFPTVIPYFAIAYVTSKTGAAEATSSLYLTPVFAFLIAWIWLGETPAASAIIGGVITLLGVFISNMRNEEQVGTNEHDVMSHEQTGNLFDA
ncbi:DMT family transporter [Lentibacillus cibarius]|uniref:DMT family transporter n=1 Tax=Lentibacillus cibarius TaxID=2583219 RepID=A0A549YEJ0_9BACI|nr:DMT family transporter [Lentibacillus cibarius]TMN21432.1 DMT family transporter [Lentibacillus cibarius]TRM10309.1 DMT family transporter [Lentibacillus cibarius]